MGATQMRQPFVLLILIAWASTSASVWVLAQGEEPLFTLADEEPLISPAGSRSEWDGQYTDPGAVVYHDGQFHMFRNGFNGWPASVQVGYLTSADGVAWTEVSEDPVFTTQDLLRRPGVPNPQPCLNGHP